MILVTPSLHWLQAPSYVQGQQELIPGVGLLPSLPRLPLQGVLWVIKGMMDGRSLEELRVPDTCEGKLVVTPLFSM